VRRLTKVGSQAFLTQLLDFGVFHGDPHGGNLLAVEESEELCILDYGLMANVPQNDKDLMVSAIIHLANKDFDGLTDDLISLKFLPETINRPKVQGVMKRVLTPYVTQGGGAKSFNVNSLISDMTSALLEIEFSIPPHYALVGRALITLEGIALIGNPSYKMVMEAYPFVADRILSENDSPKLRKALTEILYKNDEFSVARLLVLVNAALGNIATESDSFVSLDSLPTNASSLEDVVRFVCGDNAEAIREALLPEVIDAIDLLLRRETARSVGVLQASLPGIMIEPLAKVLKVDAVTKSCHLTNAEQVYLSSLVDFVSQATGISVNDILANPVGGLASELLQIGRFGSTMPRIEGKERATLLSMGERVAKGVASKAVDRWVSIYQDDH